MGINIYLDDELIEAVDRVAAAQGRSRSAVIREAVSLWLRRRSEPVWPDTLVNWVGERDFPPFESSRPKADELPSDPLTDRA